MGPNQSKPEKLKNERKTERNKLAMSVQNNSSWGESMSTQSKKEYTSHALG
jgi:hypothetical protein